jgi:flagellar hook protein FlgE
MMSAMFAGVSGLSSHQIKMDVIGNNIANVNTVGYKNSRVSFKEMLVQTISGGTAPQEDQDNTDIRGGINPMQVGLGTAIGSIKIDQSGGQLENTGNPTDMAIDGEGFFIVRNGDDEFYTRVGSFSLDVDNKLVTAAEGFYIKGWKADLQTGTITANDDSLSDITIPFGLELPPKPTSQMRYVANLDARLDIGDTVSRTMEVFDSLGNSHAITMVYTKTGVNSWQWDAHDANGNSVGPVAGGSSELLFNDSGQLISSPDGVIAFTPLNGASPVSITPSFELTQYADTTTVKPVDQDGYGRSTLKSFSIEQSGVIMGRFSNGAMRPLGQIALALFSNPQGLLKQGGTLFASSSNSGGPICGEPGVGGRGIIASERLEMSNVELSKEFTDMIITQRGFQANSRIISVADQLLEEVVNLKR